MELRHLTAFLVLYEERHFARTGARMYVSGARVTQRIQELEREIGGPLFDRNSRQVTPTALGERLHESLALPYQELLAAVEAAKASVRSASGSLRLGFTPTTGGRVVSTLVAAFEQANAGVHVRLHEVDFADPLSELRDGAVDAMAFWQVGSAAPGLAHGPVLSLEDRVLMVAKDHPLSQRTTVTTDDLADHRVVRLGGSSIDDETIGAFSPTVSASGRTIARHPFPVRTIGELVSTVARGHAVHPTVASMQHLSAYEDISFVPIVDLAPLRLGIIHSASPANEHVGALLCVANEQSEHVSSRARPDDAAGGSRTRPGHAAVT